jgi:hypothetical protein
LEKSGWLARVMALLLPLGPDAARAECDATEPRNRTRDSIRSASDRTSLESLDLFMCPITWSLSGRQKLPSPIGFPFQALDDPVRAPFRAGHTSSAEVVVHRSVQVQLLPLMEPHDRGGREILGHRGGLVRRVLGGGNAILRVGPAEPFLPENLPPARDGDRNESTATSPWCLAPGLRFLAFLSAARNGAGTRRGSGPCGV